MKNYTFIRSDPIYFDLTILQSEVPLITDKEYTVNDPLIQFSYDAFSVNPNSYNTGPTSVEVYMFTGDLLPAKLEMSCGCLIKASGFEWIYFYS